MASEDSKKRELQFRTIGGREIVGKTVDVTGESERNVERVMRNMMINMRDGLYVADTADED